MTMDDNARGLVWAAVLGVAWGCGDDGAKARSSSSPTDLGASIGAESACPAGDLAEAGSVVYACDCGAGADPDCEAGDDTSPGTSKDAPKRTYEAARTAFGALAAGDGVALCRGGVFTPDGGANDDRQWVNDRCRADLPCVVRDYDATWASGDEKKPLIDARGGPGLFFGDNAEPDHEEGYVLLNLALSGDGERGLYFRNDVDDVIACGLEIDGFDIGVQVTAGDGDNREAGQCDNITIRSSRITNSREQGFLGSCDGCALEHNEFENNGFSRATLNHNIYLSGANDGLARGVRVIGNDLYRATNIDGKCDGVSLVVHGEFEDLVIEGNTVREDAGAVETGCWGISVDTGYGGKAETFRGVVIRGNTVINPGRVGIGMNACAGCVIENNVIVHEHEEFALLGIAVPVRERESNDSLPDAVTIRNNSIFVDASTSSRGVEFASEGSGHVIVNNALHYTGNHDRFRCFTVDAPHASISAMDHNVCYAPNAPAAEWVEGAGGLGEWQASSGFDAASVMADPRFTAPSAPDFDLRPTDDSPLVGAGHPDLGATDDLEGNPRDSQPDVGAFEL